ncbi:hypothetical protein K431DRAFT_312773 [Polychaeton citri CBS 116435]|uniref:Membrane insertase YidC/Oxa/ALB C-terminal domain-containing protein n=1 Tax=Polychaeton citri CBS 116435 TaxID=1314669 RepID=A0A9P4QA87_9PEZI|nr:hypothetical protein K431DRAFT_312773 [Polychaeton citri CBS 116435]
MMPSRGLRLPKGAISPRIYQLQCRSLSSSSASRNVFQTSIRAKPSIASNAQVWRRDGLVSGLGVGAVAIGGVRNASWYNPLGWGQSKSQTPAEQAAVPASPPTPDQATSANVATTPASEPATSAIPNASSTVSTSTTPEQLPTLDSISLDELGLTAEAAKALPEHIGYLKEIGIEYGYGPTSAMQYLLEHLHIYTGLPWWATIVLFAVSVRTIMLPMYIKSADAQARASALASVTQPLMRKMKECRASGDGEGMQLAMQQMMQVRKAGGFRTFDQMAPLIVQGVVGFCMFRLLNACAKLPVPTFQEGGFLWLQDLTIQDPYLLMPVIMAGSMHLLSRFGGESGSMSLEQQGPQMRALMLYLMPGLVLLMMGWQPGAVCVWFAATGVLGITQSLVLRRPAVRAKLGIAPMYKPKPGERVENPFNMLMDSVDPSSSAGKSRGPVYTAQSTAASTQKPTAPQWQAPNLGNSGKVIDVNGTSTAAQSSSSGSATGGIFDQAKNQYLGMKKKMNDQVTKKREEAKIAAQKKRADDYERRASERGR